MQTNDENQMTSLSQPFKKLSLNAAKINHQFFLLVRDQKYDEAYELGQKILHLNPNNPSIQHFCDFIKNNHQGLAQMLQQQQYESEDEDDDYEQQDDDEEESEEQQEKSISRTPSQSVLSKSSSRSFETIKAQPKQSSSSKKFVVSQPLQMSKKQINKENAHKWDHNCKNPDCPNKNKPHKH